MQAARAVLFDRAPYYGFYMASFIQGIQSVYIYIPGMRYEEEDKI